MIHDMVLGDKMHHWKVLSKNELYSQMKCKVCGLPVSSISEHDSQHLKEFYNMLRGKTWHS